MTGRGTKVAAALVRLSSTSLLRALTVDLNDLTSTAYEIGSITEQVSGDCIESVLGREKLPGWFLVFGRSIVRSVLAIGCVISMSFSRNKITK